MSAAVALQPGVPLALAHAAYVAPRLAARVQGLGEQAPSDLSFANLWLFRRIHDYRLLEADWPVIRGRTYDGQSHWLPLFSLADAPVQVLRDLLAGGECFYPVAQCEVARLDPQYFIVDSQRDDADYLYDADTFRHYRGPRLHNKRNLLKQCLANHRLHVQPYTPELQEVALQILNAWLQDKGKQSGDADDLPCREALALAPQLGLQGFLAWADGEPAGFVLAEELQPGVFVMRFAKGLARFKGISQAMFQHFAAHVGPPARWINFEQDMGLPNFRRTKMSYQPQALLLKCRVRWKD